MECEPGEEAQVDFGTGAFIITPEGTRRKTHVFRIVLSHSRKGYSQATLTQTTDDFLGALENSFRHVGGVPRTLVIDNLKAAVGDVPSATAILDRFLHHAAIITITGRSYRLRNQAPAADSGAMFCISSRAANPSSFFIPKRIR